MEAPFYPLEILRRENHGTDLITERTALRVCPPVSPHVHSDTVIALSVSVSPPSMFTVHQEWHSDSDTVSTCSVSVSAPGIFYVHQEWHSDADNSSSSSVSVSPLVCSMSSRVWHPPAQAPLRRGAVLRLFPHMDTRVYRMRVP